LKNGQKGQVQTYKGYCLSDPSDVLCCVKKVTQLASGTKLSKTGTCKIISQCPTSSYMRYNNQCPGNSNIKLCVPKSSNSGSVQVLALKLVLKLVQIPVPKLILKLVQRLVQILVQMLKHPINLVHQEITSKVFV